MLDIETIISAVVPSVAASMAGVYWLSKTLIHHRLTTALESRKAELQKDLEGRKEQLQEDLETYKSNLHRSLEIHKSELQADLEKQKAEWQGDLARDKAMVEGAIKRQVELDLGERGAQREYELEARKRLYHAIGPLRFQLLLACRDFAGRIEAYGTGRRYWIEMSGYYGRTTLYRLLCPLGISELIERQVAYSDFAVDSAALDCLRFKKSARHILSGDELVGDFPDYDWNNPSQHAFAQHVSTSGNALICGTPGEQREIKRFDEFDKLSGEEFQRFFPFPWLLQDFDMTKTPILWLRLVAYANACNAFVNHAGANIGFERRDFPLEQLMLASGNAYIADHKDDYRRRLAEVVLMPL